ncbi:MAG TPA: NAD(P)-dependent oxidoreductase [Methylomirabilota bacterium]|jgi:3-hydroxyisobutyrate dehydrogenase-like beta-hydroxyacid dehydrogenase
MLVGVVGLGLLGHAVAARLRAAGHEVIGHDILPARVKALLALGGRDGHSVSGVVEAADLVCVVLPSLAAVDEVVLGPAGIVAAARRGRTVAQMSTISLALTERLARECQARGLGFLDCPVSGTSGMVERGDGIIFVGGERALHDRWRPVLEGILPRAVFIGSAGQAMALKLVANLLVALNSAAAAEALSMAERAGLDVGVALEVLTASAASSRMLEVRGPMIARREFPPQMKLDLFMKDLHLIQDAAAAVGAPLPLTDVAEALYRGAQAAGHGAEDLAVVVTQLT